MKKILFILFLLYYYNGIAANYPEVSCSIYSDSTGCNQCFDGGKLYKGISYAELGIYDEFKNNTSSKIVYYQDENTITHRFKVYNNTSIYKSNNLLKYPDTFVWYTASTGRYYHVFKENSNERFLEAPAGYGIRLDGVNIGGITDKNLPIARLDFISNYRYFLGAGKTSDIKTHKECVFYKAARCGDGVLDTTKSETCDPNDTSKIGWGTGGCDANCKPINTPSPTSTCDNLTASPITGNTPFSSTMNCSGTNASSYSIDCGNGQTINGANGSCNYTTAGSYTARCTVNGNITSAGCTKTITATATSIGDGGGGGGGSSNVCYALSAKKNSDGSYDFSCRGSSNQYTIDIRDVTGTGNVLLYTFTNTGGVYSIPSSGNYTAQCYVGPTNSTDTTKCKLTFNGSSYCGDGILQRPNSNGINEECDFGKGTWPNWCDKYTCDINENTVPGGGTKTGDSEITIPGGGNLIITPSGKMVVGDNMKIFSLIPNQAIIRNTSTSYVYIDKKMCVYNKEKTPYEAISGNDLCSSAILGTIAPNGGYRSMIVPNNRFVSNTDTLPNGYTYADSEIITTFEGLQDTNSFLRSVLEVRVAKPSISTLGGGAGTIKTANISDINKLSVGGFSDEKINNNLILTSLSQKDPLSSFVKTLSGTSLSETISKEGKIANNLGKINGSSFSIKNINKLPDQNYNGLENVFIHKGNVNLSSQNITGGNKTYIIDGNLIIGGDITSSNNILFVVRNGDIIIKDNVQNIDAILINMDGKVKGETKTDKKLIINGALYGKDVSDIIAKRTYIKDRGSYIDVGTMINFTSKIFVSPPPLLSTFLRDFLNTKKVAK